MIHHPTLDQVEEAVMADEMIGWCSKCGAEVDNVEPDARENPCPKCGARAVKGAEEWLFDMAFAPGDPPIAWPEHEPYEFGSENE